MASFFKNLFRKESDSQPVPAAALTSQSPESSRVTGFAEAGEAAAVGARSGLPQSAGGPLSAVSGRQMTARELAAFLPPALLRYDGVSPDQPVPLPVDLLRLSLAAGRPVLRLSQIQTACPLLFQRAPQGEEDVEVTLPLARIKGILEDSGAVPAPANPFEARGSAGAGFAPASANPFAAVSQPPVAPPLPGAGSASPFPATPVLPSVPAASPFGTVTAPSVAESVNPFPLPPSPVGAESASPSPFHNLSAAVGSPFTTVPNQTTSPLPEAPAIISGTTPLPLAPTGGASAPVAPSAFPAMGTASADVSPFQDLVGPAPVAQVVEPVKETAASPFQVVTPTTFPAAVPTGGGAPAASVPYAPMQPKPFGVPASPPTLGGPPPPVAPASLPPLATSNPGFTPVSSQRPAVMAWTPPPASPLPSSGVTSLPVLPRVTPAPPVRIGEDVSSEKAVPSLPPLAAAFPSPFQAVTPSLPAGPPVPDQPPVPVVRPLPVVAPSVQPSVSTPVPSPAGSGPVPSGGTVELSLRAVLRDVDSARLGFAPENVPETVRVTFPLELITRQLATGKVEVGLEEIRAGLAEKFRPAFARAVAGLQVLVPMSEVFHNLPESAKPALEPAAPGDHHLSITTSPFQTPFAIKAEEDRKPLLDLSSTGFDPAQIGQRPATQPVPATDRSHAPLPPVVPATAGVPTVHVDLPVLRPAASAAPSAVEAPPALPRTGMLSRPPGSGTAPTPPPRTAPRLKPVPISPTALRTFPKPPLPSESGAGPAVTPVLPPPLLPQADNLNPPPPLLAAELPPLMPPVAPLAPPPLSRNPEPELHDDLGESFSAARLSTEPPPRAGSAPVILPARFPETNLYPTLQEASQPEVRPSLLQESAPVVVIPENTEPPVAPVLMEALVAPAGEPSVLQVPDPAVTVADGVWPPPAIPADSGIVALESSPPPLPPPLPVMTAPPLETAPLPETGPAPRLVVSSPIPPPSGAGPVEDLSFGCVSEIRQLTLRAVLGTDQVLTPQEIVDRCAGLAGLKACALFRQDNALVSQGMDPGTAASFRTSAGQTRDSLLALADSLGLGSGGNFTLRTDHGVRSFFLEPGLCLAVWHDQPAFTPGTREKLILIAQEIARA